MSENKSKAEKLAEGRKKLKQFQAKLKKPKTEDDKVSGVASENGSEDQASVGSVSDHFSPPAMISQPPVIAFPAYQHEKSVSSEILTSKNIFGDRFPPFPGENLPNVPAPMEFFAQRKKTPPHSESLKDELFTILQDVKLRNAELETHVKEQTVEIDNLRQEVLQLREYHDSAPSSEVAQLRDQLQSHAQTLTVLVEEKANLTVNLATSQSQLRVKDQEIEELQAKLSASRHQVQDFKLEITTMRESLAKFDNMQNNLCSENETAREKVKNLTEKCEDLSEEVSELKQKLLLKNREMSDVTEELKKSKSELSLAQLRVEQLSAGDTHAADVQIEGMAQQRATLQHQMTELLTQVEKITLERDQAATQYQNYVTQLNRESTKMVQKLQEITQERDQLARREGDLVKHVGELEKQLQAHMTQPKLAETSKEQNEEQTELLKKLQKDLSEVRTVNDQLKISLKNSEDERSKVHTLLEEKATNMRDLEMKMERLETSYVDPLSLNATLESEKVAAARAVSQNLELKAQLEEMQRAYVQMTHDKASLMDQLQSEQHLGREMRGKLDGWEEEVSGLRQKLHFKDEEMMRLSHENSELEKKTLLQNQELDRLRHCEMGQQTSNLLQLEVQKQKQQVAHLEEIIRKQREVEKLVGEIQEEAPSEKEDEDVHEAVENGVIFEETLSAKVMPTEEAMQKLEERFRKTMDDIAELTDEKQRLEHLVTQLQGETETIGEYVTLYQTQRQILKQREIEKDDQVQRIAADREEMRQKLVELNNLVELLLQQKNIDIPAGLGKNGDHSVSSPEDSANSSESHDSQQVPESRSEETAEKILHLLSEIKTTNLNTTNLVVPPGVVHHCSCCSGKLITV
ncbi:Golgin subfamily A [Sergentomyia squamirostris]